MMSLTPDSAARYVRVAQIGAVMAAALAVGVFIAPAGDPVVTPPPPPRSNVQLGGASDEPEGPTFDPQVVLRQDWTTVVPALRWATPEVVTRAEEPEEPEPDAGEADGAAEGEGETAVAQGEGQQGDETFNPTPALIQNWKYLGPVLAGRGSSALMEIGGMQRFIFEGQRISGFSVAAVEQKRVILERSDGRYAITLSDEALGGGDDLGGPRTPGDARRPETAQERLERLRELREQQQRRRDEALERGRDGASRS